MKKKNNFFLKKLTEAQFNITRRTRSNSFYTLDLLILQRELKLLLRLLRHAHNKASKMFLKTDNNSSFEEILKELIENLNLQIGILCKKNSTTSKTNTQITTVKTLSSKLRRVSEPAKTVFLFEKCTRETYKEIQKLYPYNIIVSFAKYVNKLSSTYNINNDFTDVKKLIFILVFITKAFKI